MYSNFPIIIGLILLLLACFFMKNTIYENLVVAPTHLYSSNNRGINKICNIKNDNPINGKRSFININTLLKIRNPNPEQRPGIEVVGYKIRINLPDFNVVKPNIEKKKNKKIYCDYLKSENQEEIVSETEEIISEEINFIKNLENQPDITPDEDYYFNCNTKSCWYNATIINYIYKNPVSLHKIAWYNRYHNLETKWIDLYQYDIHSPIEPYDKLFSQMINDNENKYTNSQYYYKKTELDSGLSSTYTQEQEENNLDCVDKCKIPPKINYFGNIDCSKNEDCHKYGSYFCKYGKCDINYININLNN